jgi:hypothetical protein
VSRLPYHAEASDNAGTVNSSPQSVDIEASGLLAFKKATLLGQLAKHHRVCAEREPGAWINGPPCRRKAGILVPRDYERIADVSFRIVRGICAPQHASSSFPWLLRRLISGSSRSVQKLHPLSHQDECPDAMRRHNTTRARSPGSESTLSGLRSARTGMLLVVTALACALNEHATRAPCLLQHEQRLRMCMGIHGCLPACLSFGIAVAGTKWSLDPTRYEETRRWR